MNFRAGIVGLGLLAFLAVAPAHAKAPSKRQSQTKHGLNDDIDLIKKPETLEDALFKKHGIPTVKYEFKPSIELLTAVDYVKRDFLAGYGSRPRIFDQKRWGIMYTGRYLLTAQHTPNGTVVNFEVALYYKSKQPVVVTSYEFNLTTRQLLKRTVEERRQTVKIDLEKGRLLQNKKIPERSKGVAAVTPKMARDVYRGFVRDITDYTVADQKARVH